VLGGVVDERSDAVGAVVIDRGVELSQACLEVLPLGGGGCDRPLTLLVILRQGVEPFTQGAFGPGRLLQVLFGDGSAGAGGGDRLVVVAAPSPPPCLLQRSLALSEGLLGVVACPQYVGKPPAGVVPFRGPIGGDRRIEPAEVGESRGPGVA
jgi:hypothetical protein